MSLCEYCNNESKLLFICTQCGKRLCKEHRSPENHSCGVKIKEDDVEEIIESKIIDKVDEKKIHVEETAISQEIIPSRVITELEEDSQYNLKIENQLNNSEIINNESKYIPIVANSEDPESIKKNSISNLFRQLSEHKLPLTIIIITSLMTGAFAGVLVSPPEDSNLEQRYDALYEYYQELQSRNQDINQELENTINQIGILENQLSETLQILSYLQEDWDKVFSDQIQYKEPTLSQLRTWLSTDQTDKQITNQENTPLHQALQLTLKAKSHDWKLGVIIVYGNFQNDKNNHTFNIIHIENEFIEEAYVYLDPETDTIWWNQNYEKIIQDQVYTLGNYTSVNITRIDTILEP